MTPGVKKILLTLVAVLVVLAGTSVEAAVKRKQTKQFHLTQSSYASSIRWNEFDSAWTHVDPAFRKEHPLSDLDRARFKQIQVSGYTELSQEILADGDIELRVEIRVVNRNTQSERSFTDKQTWRWDAVAKRWWLMTGLPDFTARSI